MTTGCTIGDKLFYGFAYGGGASVSSASSVGVTPILTPNDPGVQFNAAWAVPVGTSGDATIFFNVAVSPGGGLIEDDSLGLGGVGNITGDANIKVVEGVCLGQALNASNVCTGPTQNPVLEVDAPNTTSTFFKEIVFPNGLTYNTLGIMKDIGLHGGTVAGGGSGANLSIITQQFSEVPVPEPMGVLLLGTCLFAIAPVLRRKLG